MYKGFQLSIFSIFFRDKEDRLLVLIKYLALGSTQLLLLGFSKTGFKEFMVLFNLIVKIKNF